MLTGCRWDNKDTFQGYIENDLTYIASPFSGKLLALSVKRGDHVKQGTRLFSLDSQPQSDDVDNAAANMASAKASLEDIKKGARDTKLDEIKAQISQAEADLAYNKKEYERRKELMATENIQVDLYDQAVRDVDKITAMIAQYTASLNDAKLPARSDQIHAAKETLKAATALLQKAKWSLAQKTQTAPADARVFDTYYSIGELAPQNTPVVSLMISDKNKAIIFVPEAELSRLNLGAKAHVGCDGCEADLDGNISFISPKAEYTPPVVYSHASRAKLVYRIEVDFTPSTAMKLHPGQAVDVTL